MHADKHLRPVLALGRGWAEDDCAALAGGNLLRALRAAEATARA